MKVTGIIPCRMESTRFPGKPLVKIAGIPMIQRVYSQAKKAEKLDDLFVASDSEEIIVFCRQNNIPVIKTGQCLSGSDRVYKACERLESNVLVNIQGDEPLISPGVINSVIEPFYGNNVVKIVTARKKISDDYEIHDTNIVKVVCDKEGFAMYFSRCSIPFDKTQGTDYYKHIGIYAYTKSVLKDFVSLEQGKIEKSESLEQLRFLENGYKIYTVITGYDSMGVDVPEDIYKVEKLLKAME